MRKVLFIGASGTGKTVTISKLMKRDGRPTYLLNGEKSGEQPYTKVSWDKALQLSRCNVIVEGTMTNQYMTTVIIISFSRSHFSLGKRARNSTENVQSDRAS